MMTSYIKHITVGVVYGCDQNLRGVAWAPKTSLKKLAPMEVKVLMIKNCGISPGTYRLETMNALVTQIG